jgi:hypothetical protein
MHFALILNGLENGMNVCFEHHAPHDDFIQDVVHTVGVKDKIELANILETLVESFHKDLYEIEYTQVALLRINLIIE